MRPCGRRDGRKYWSMLKQEQKRSLVSHQRWLNSWKDILKEKKMKKISELSVNSLTHCYTSVFELEKGDKFYSEISNLHGAMRFYEVTLKRGKNEYTATFYRVKDNLIIVNDDDGIGPGALFYHRGWPVFSWPRLVLPVMGREIGHANFARPGELRTKIARKICRANNITRIEFPGDFGPLWYKDEYLVPDFNESGTGYYVAPAWVLEKAGYRS